MNTWAVFPCHGALPKALQDVNTRIWNEWLPNCTEYSLGGNYDIEMYTAPTEDPAKTYSEIWIPVVNTRACLKTKSCTKSTLMI